MQFSMQYSVVQAQQAFLASRDVEATTRSWYRRMTDSLIGYLAGPDPNKRIPVECVPLAAITADSVRAWRDWLVEKTFEDADGEERRLAAATVNSYLRAARVWLKWLEGEGCLAPGAPQGLKRVRQQRRRLKFISDADRDRMFDAAETDRDYAILRMLAATGCRRSEVTAMQIGDLAFRRGRRWMSWREARRQITPANWQQWRGRVRVLGKGSKVRIVFFGSATAAALFDYLTQRTDADPALWVSHRGRLSSEAIRWIVGQAAERAKPEGPVNPHAWRHAFAKGMLRNGADLKTVSVLLGHSSITVTADVYIGLTDDELDERHEKFAWAD